MKKRVLRSVSIVALCVVILGCMLINAGTFNSAELSVTTPETEENESQDSLITVGFSQVGSESVWRSANSNSIKNALSEKNGFLLDFVNARQKQENQIKAVRRFISQQVDYILIAPITESGWDTILQDAKEAGIPVIIVDRMVDVSDDSLYTAFVGTDKYEEGRKAGAWLEEYERENFPYDEESEEGPERPLNIVVLKGTEGSTAQSGRSKGFEDIYLKHRNWHILAEIDADFTTLKGKEVMASLLERYDDIDVVISQNDDMAFGAIEALNEAGYTTGIDGDVAVVAFDGTKKALRMVRDGIINADVECNPIQGEMIANLINLIENGQPFEKINNIDELTFTIYNVNAHLNSRKY